MLPYIIVLSTMAIIFMIWYGVILMLYKGKIVINDTGAGVICLFGLLTIILLVAMGIISNTLTPKDPRTLPQTVEKEQPPTENK